MEASPGTPPPLPRKRRFPLVAACIAVAAICTLPAASSFAFGGAYSSFALLMSFALPVIFAVLFSPFVILAVWLISVKRGRLVAGKLVILCSTGIVSFIITSWIIPASELGAKHRIRSLGGEKFAETIRSKAEDLIDNAPENANLLIDSEELLLEFLSLGGTAVMVRRHEGQPSMHQVDIFTSGAFFPACWTIYPGIKEHDEDLALGIRVEKGIYRVFR